jgi:outer membrane protein TolC
VAWAFFSRLPFAVMLTGMLAAMAGPVMAQAPSGLPGAGKILELIEANGGYAFAAAAADLSAAKAKVNGARARLFPRLTYTATAKRLDAKVAGETRNSEVRSSLELAQTIYDFGETDSLIRAARSDAVAAKERLRAATNMVLLEGLAVFYDLHASEAQIQALKQEHARLYVRWDRARERERLGKMGPIKVAEWLAKVERSRLAYHRERSRNSILRLRLEDLTATPVNGALYNPPRPPAKKPPEVDVDELIKFAEKHNPDLTALAAKAQSLGIRRDGTGSLPRLEAFGNVAQSTREFRSRENWAFGARLSWPIFDGGIKSAERSRLAAKQAKVLAEYEVRRRGLRRELRKMVLSRADSWQQIIAAKANLDFYGRRLTLRKRLFQQERVTDLGGAMVQFSQGEADLIRATGAYFVDSARLAVLLGANPARGLKAGFLGALLGEKLSPGGNQFTPKGGSGFGQKDQNTPGH